MEMGIRATDIAFGEAPRILAIRDLQAGDCDRKGLPVRLNGHALFVPKQGFAMRFAIAALGLFLGSVDLVQAQPLKYPPTRQDNVEEVLHGMKIVDPYRWLEEGGSAETKAWVEEQNRFTQSILGKYPGRAKIRSKLSDLLEIGSIGVAHPVRGHYLYTRREGNQNQPILFVRDGVRGKDRVLIDPNELAKDGTIALDWWYPSKDGKLLAYGLSRDGSEQSTLRVREIESGKDLPDVIERTRAASVAWMPDASGFWYTRYPAVGSVAKGQENYFRHVFFHKLGTDPKDDPKVFGEGRSPEDWHSVSVSPDGRWLAVTASQGWAKSEIFVRDNEAKDAAFVPLAVGIKANFSVTLRNDRFYVQTNHDAPRYRIYRVEPTKVSRKDWVEIIPEGKDKLETVAAIGDHLIVEKMRNATSTLAIHDRDGKHQRDIDLPTLGTVAGLGGEWNGNEIFYGFQSFTMAQSIYRVDLKSNASELWDRVKTGIDPEQYGVEQVKVESKDGTPVTMFLTHKKGLKRDGTNPTLLYGYGGFNISLTPTFSAIRFMFLEKGGVLAIPNLRGGGEYGEEWHRAGMLDKKQSTFDDFLASAEWLIANKITTREKLCIQGGSNGGLLVGAALTQRPELFKAVVCQVPLLDMTRFHRFLIARLWIPEYGDPEKAEDFKWIWGYSPYQKVKEGAAYPAVLLTTAASDTRVDPLHARKMAARLQRATNSSSPILLRQETTAGHGAGKPRGLILDEQTDIWCFLFQQWGIEP